jgi:phosphotransferase system enzyme I (PtsI)
VLRSIKNIIECGKKEGLVVGMCGEGARDPMLIPLLLAFGLDEFSVSPTSVLAARSCISRWSMEEAREAADKAMSLPTYIEVEEYLKSITRK